MTIFLTVLLTLLKCLGIIFLVLLLLLIVLLFTPVGVDASWAPGQYSVYARVGLLRFLLAPRPAAKKKKQTKKKSEDSAPQPQPSADKAPEATAKKESEAPKDIAKAGNTENKIKAYFTKLAERLKADPIGTIQALLDEFSPLGARLLHGLHIRHLTIFWTVTRDEASETAIAYGQEIAAANILLAQAQQILDIQADDLRLEPDFTGDMAKKRHMYCQITVRPYIMIIIGAKLLWKYLHPATKNAAT